MTLLLIVVGGIISVTTAVTHSNQVDKIVGISGGLLSAGLGATDIFVATKSVALTHKRNLLADIWNESENSSTHSPFVWYVLSQKPFSNDDKRSIRSHIRERWWEYVLVGTSAKQKELYFGKGNQ